MTERVLGEKGSKRRKRFLLLPVLATAALALFWIAGAQAVHDVGVFQLDGNADTATNPAPTANDDWDRVCFEFTGSSATCGTATGTTGATATSWIAEPNRATTIFTGGGSKDPELLEDWLWKDGAGGLPDKDNLRHAFAARYVCDNDDVLPDNCTGIDGEVYLYFGSDRFDNSGDAVEGFWFFQNPVCADGGSSQGGQLFTDCAGGTPEHKAGDLLVLSDFSNGGQVATINIYEWVDSGGDTTTHLDFVDGSTNVTCALALTDDNFCGIVNPGTITMPWSFADKSGTPNNGALNGEFFEAGVNLSFLDLGDVCFSSFLNETRASTSPTATLKDFVLGGFGRCEAGIESTQTWAPADSATITVSGASVWTGTVTFSLHTSSDCSEASQVYESAAISVDNTDATASTNDAANVTKPSPIGVAGNGTYYWNVHFEALTPSQLENEDSCVEQTALTIDDDNS